MTNYRVWAPYATEARLLLGNSESPTIITMTPAGQDTSTRVDQGSEFSGWFEADVPRVPGDRYAFQLRTTAGHGAMSDADATAIAEGEPGSDERGWTIPLPDPRSTSQPEGPHGFSEVVDASDNHQWRDSDWTGRILPGGVIYELHVGTFSDSGDFAGVIKHLDHLVELGVTHIELMPVQPFGGNRNWGYDGVCWHAVHEGYGGATGLQQLIDACHRKGLAVILDVVYNHFGPDGNYVGFFGPYMSSAATDWGDVVNLTGEYSDEVRHFILDAVRQWFVDYHVDGLRLDAVHALHDDGAFHILEQMQEVADTVAAETGIPRTLIAESDQNDPRLTRPRAAGGYGLGAQWDDDVHHALHALVSGENHSYFADFGTVDILAETLENGFYHLGKKSTFRGRTHGRPFDLTTQPMSSFVTYTTTHDQTGNRAIGDRPSMNLSAAQQVLKAAVIATSPFTPMLFQGEEWGAKTPFAFFCSHESEELQRMTREGRLREFARAGWDPEQVPDPSSPATYENSKLNWAEPASAEHREILQSYRELFALRHQLPVLRNPWAHSLSTATGSTDKWMVISRGQKDQAVALAANFSSHPVTLNLLEDAPAPLTQSISGPEQLSIAHTFSQAAADLNGAELQLPAWGYAIITTT